jgi:serine/threonine protein kinase
VYRAINWNTNQVLAVKQIQLEGSKEDEIGQLILLEVDLVKQLSHPNIIKYGSVVRDKNTLSIAFECVLHDPVHPSLGFGTSFFVFNI